MNWKILQVTLRCTVSIMVLGSLLFLVSCMDDSDAMCNDCPANTPWSTPSSGTCYATQAECEDAEGGSCIRCI